MVLGSLLTVGTNQSVFPADSQLHRFCALTWTQTEVSAVCWMESQATVNCLSFSLSSWRLVIFSAFFLPFSSFSHFLYLCLFLLLCSLLLFQPITDVCGALCLCISLYSLLLLLFLSHHLTVIPPPSSVLLSFAPSLQTAGVLAHQGFLPNK